MYLFFLRASVVRISMWRVMAVSLIVMTRFSPELFTVWSLGYEEAKEVTLTRRVLICLKSVNISTKWLAF